MYSAVYLPSCEVDPSCSGFASTAEANQWIIDHMCDRCKEEYHRSTMWNNDFDINSSTPPCLVEWIIIETVKLSQCENLGDMFDAAGFQRVETQSNQ